MKAKIPACLLVLLASLIFSCRQDSQIMPPPFSETDVKKDSIWELIRGELSTYLNSEIGNEQSLSGARLNWDDGFLFYNLSGKPSEIILPITKGHRSFGFLRLVIDYDKKAFKANIKGHYDRRNDLYNNIDNLIRDLGYSTEKLSFVERKFELPANMESDIFNHLVPLPSEDKLNIQNNNVMINSNCGYMLSGLYLASYYSYDGRYECSPDIIHSTIQNAILTNLNNVLHNYGGRAVLMYNHGFSVTVPSLSTSEVYSIFARASSLAHSNFPCIGSFQVINIEISGGCNIGGGGGGGGGGNNENQMPAEAKISHDLDDYPCAVDLVNHMKVSTQRLSAMFSNIFGGSQTKINLTFHPKVYTDIYMDGGKRGGTSIYDAHIDLNTHILENSTQEYVLATMYHEVFHAYLEVERYHLGNEIFEAKYPELKVYRTSAGDKYIFQTDANHNRFGEYIEYMKIELKTFNPSLPNDVIESMVTAGLFEYRTDQDVNLNLNERDVRNNNFKGTKCQK